VNILNKQSRIADKGWFSSLSVGRGANNTHRKKVTCYEMFQSASVIKSWRMRWAGHVARMEEGRGVYRVLVGRPEGKRPL
jgi:hypothetical protein